jgi:hypothetical protein
MGQTLRFYARKDYLVNSRPGWTPSLGQAIPRVNRSLPVKTPNGYACPALPDAFECDSDSDAGRSILRKFARKSGKTDPPLWCADKATATACGVPFVAVELVDGEWIPKKSGPPKAAKPKPVDATV